MREALARAIGSHGGEVRFDAGSRALYATDGSNFRQVPLGVVIPRHADDVVAAVEIARRFEAPLLPRGGGTSLAGQCCNAALVLDFTKFMHEVLEVDAARRIARVQPGVPCDDIKRAAHPHGLTFGPDPATHNHCVIGGMIGNNSCGAHSVMAGKTDDNVEWLDVLLYDGTRMRAGAMDDAAIRAALARGGREGDIVRRLLQLRDRYAGEIRRRYPDIPRRVSGYNLPELLPERGFHLGRALVGSEGTCVTVLEAGVRLVTDPAARVVLVLGFDDVYAAGDHVPDVLRFGPIALEGMDAELIGYMKKKHLHQDDLHLLPPGGGWLIAEFGGDSPEAARAAAERAARALRHGRHVPHAHLVTDPDAQRRVWKVRESGLPATAFVPGMRDTWEGWEDSAVPPERLGDYLRDFRRLLDRFGYACALYGHFGQGCVHVRIDFELETRAGIDHYREFLQHAADLVVGYGGSLSGEHGDGQTRGQLLPKMFGDELMQAFREFKAIWDPDLRMNPGKLIDAYLPDENLRLGVDYRPATPRTQFHYADDRGSFARATLRCVGVGECRRERDGTMCPSYRVTRDERHSTRGRARLLFEMLRGDPIGRRGWREPAVKEALDLCLSCKGCKGDCPVGVDMATYKAEFLSHWWAGRPRPAHAYAMGLIAVWARAAARAPGLVNWTTHARGVGALARRLAGIAPSREMPRFAARTFRRRLLARDGLATRAPAPDAPRVVLWPDTFTHHFHPDVGLAAVEVLERAGFRVELPPRQRCCGRPLYDYGMLDTARRWLQAIVRDARPWLEDGTPLVVLEPSCAAVFRDELTNLLGDHADARRLAAQTHTLGEFLAHHAGGRAPGALPGRALHHAHCHQKALMGADDDARLLQDLGLDVDRPDTGCCGMAGSFGFERGHEDVSRAIGELVLLPAVRAAAPDTLLVADGFSCREQIRQETGREALHLAQVLRLAQRRGEG
ncbi:MAG TPA: FAD-binding and (Fe-S)-binding domain-containing protein [Candidatus Eisenbacteria bacterium]|nr:FAD-binding and (Fe-S)-binding domain-containing protein [Candidatus Eisenbacteria bacterium]